MKVIILNRKRIGVTLIIIGLMVILFASEKIFDERLKHTTLINSDIENLKTYSALEGRIIYRLPENWESHTKDFHSKEILYHNDFNSEDMKISGFIQVWNYKQELKEFLEKSKEISLKENKVENYKMEPIKISGHEGYVINYKMTTSPGIKYVAYEYFLRNKDEFIRFSFFVKEEYYKENMTVIFESLVSTLKVIRN